MAGYIGNYPTAVPLTSADIQDGTIGIADLSATGTKDSTTFLRGDNTFQAVSSDYVLLATVDASSSASVSFDGYFSATYKNYQVILSDVFPTATNGFLRKRFRRSNADITTSNYTDGGGGSYQYAGVGSGFKYFGSANGVAYIRCGDEDGQRGTSNYAHHEITTIYSPLSTNTYKVLTSQIGLTQRTDASNYNYTIVGTSGMLYDNTNALSGISFYMSTGNIASGTFKLYGIK